MATRQSKTATGEKAQYLSNKDLLAEVRVSREKGEMTNTLARMLQLLCTNYARKGKYVNYSYNEDMQAYAMMMLVRTWKSFDPDKGSNPFAFYTQCIKNSFIQFLKLERKQRNIRDALMIKAGLNPSFGFEDDGAHGPIIEDETDFDTMRQTIEMQTRSAFIDSPIERDETGVEITPEPPVEDDLPVDDDGEDRSQDKDV